MTIRSRLGPPLRRLRRAGRVFATALWPGHVLDPRRIVYQAPAIRFEFRPDQRVLDIGSGGDPFPHATVLCDRFLEPTRHRSETFVAAGRPVIIGDVQQLPFRDASFDYVLCSHLLEHVDDPIAACRELQRVAPAGFIETPTFMKDALFCWAKDRHRWFVVARGARLFFFEYTAREQLGIGSPIWREIIFGPSYHPLQQVFDRNQDLFNVLFEWRGRFEVTVVRTDGSVATTSPDCSDENRRR